MARKPKSEPVVETKRSRKPKGEGDPKPIGEAVKEAGLVQPDAPKKRGRPPGSGAPKLAAVDGKILNSVLSDTETSALYFQHLARYKAADAKVKTAVSESRNVLQRAAVDLGANAKSYLQDGLALEKDGGLEKMRAELDRKAAVARWHGLPIMAQASLFDVDRRPAEEIAELEGFQAGATDGKAKVPDKYAPSSPEGQAYLRGVHRGRDAIVEAAEKTGGPTLLKGSTKAPRPNKPSPSLLGDEPKAEEPKPVPVNGEIVDHNPLGIGDDMPATHDEMGNPIATDENGEVDYGTAVEGDEAEPVEE